MGQNEICYAKMFVAGGGAWCALLTHFPNLEQLFHEVIEIFD